MIKIRTAVTAVALSLCASASMAAVVTINSVAGAWTSTTPGSVYGLNGSSTGSFAEINWGDPVNDVDQSGYSFEGLIPPPVVVDTATSAEFDLGIFTHNNFAIWANVPFGAPAISSANLSVDFALSIDGNDYALNQVYTFAHDETPNQPSGDCAYGGSAGSGINGTFGCNDQVTAVLNEGLSETVVVDGMEFTFDISGFRHDDETFSFFRTQEGRANEAILVGQLLVTELPSEVPLPAAGWLLLAGIGGMAAVSRKRRAS